MSRLVSVLFPEPALYRSPLKLWKWWETRRLTYNLVVGAAGLVTIGVVQLALILPGHIGPPVFPWPVVVAYGIAANVCYSFGWLAESVLQRWLARETYGLGPALYRHGLVFSVGLTLFPAVLISIGSIARIISLLVR
jgi:hypothetical protein